MEYDHGRHLTLIACDQCRYWIINHEFASAAVKQGTCRKHEAPWPVTREGDGCFSGIERRKNAPNKPE